MKRKLITLLSIFIWLLAFLTPTIVALQNNIHTKHTQYITILGITGIILILMECLFSKYHEKLHVRVAKHYHPECEYKIIEDHFSCSNPKAFSHGQIRIVAISANALNFVIAIPFAIIIAVSLGIEPAISILIVSLYNFIIASDNKSATDGYLLIFPEKFYEVGGF